MDSGIPSKLKILSAEDGHYIYVRNAASVIRYTNFVGPRPDMLLVVPANEVPVFHCLSYGWRPQYQTAAAL